MSKFEILVTIFMIVVFLYMYFDFRYKDALANAVHSIVKQVGGKNNEK